MGGNDQEVTFELSDEQFARAQAIAEAETFWDAVRAARLSPRDIVGIPWFLARPWLMRAARSIGFKRRVR